MLTCREIARYDDIIGTTQGDDMDFYYLCQLHADLCKLHNELSNRIVALRDDDPDFKRLNALADLIYDSAKCAHVMVRKAAGLPA